MCRIIVGSKQWCEQWAKFHVRVADKFINRNDETLDDLIMYHLFMHEFWITETPWA